MKYYFLCRNSGRPASIVRLSIVFESDESDVQPSPSIDASSSAKINLPTDSSTKNDEFDGLGISKMRWSLTLDEKNNTFLERRISVEQEGNVEELDENLDDDLQFDDAEQTIEMAQEALEDVIAALTKRASLQSLVEEYDEEHKAEMEAREKRKSNDNEDNRNNNLNVTRDNIDGELEFWESADEHKIFDENDLISRSVAQSVERSYSREEPKPEVDENMPTGTGNKAGNNGKRFL